MGIHYSFANGKAKPSAFCFSGEEWFEKKWISVLGMTQPLLQNHDSKRASCIAMVSIF
jgi:hypothetical protein